MAIDHRSPPFPSRPPKDEDRPVSSLIATIPAPDERVEQWHISPLVDLGAYSLQRTLGRPQVS